MATNYTTSYITSATGLDNSATVYIITSDGINDFDIKMPSVSGITGRCYKLIRTDSNGTTVNVIAADGETMIGQDTIQLYLGSVELIADETNSGWQVLNFNQ